jgi:4-amino-4-deoxy-L-arabinose transferase-like glycosyltransferase
MNYLTKRYSLPRTFLILLAISLLSYLCAIDWGLPSPKTWAADELVPHLVNIALESNFSGGWHTQYPSLHFMLIAICHAPFNLLGVGSDFTLTLVGRTISVAMAVVSLVLLYKLARRFLTSGWAIVAVSLFAFAPQTVYYAKIANLDIPYLFWLLCSLVVFWNMLETHRTREYVLFAIFTMAAICTKEQAYGFYVLLIPLFFYSRWQKVGWSQLIMARSIGLAFLVAVVSFLLFQNIFFNPDGFVNHVNLITGAKFSGYKMYHPTLAGHTSFLLLSIEQITVVMGLPAALAALFGVGLALYRKEKFCWLLLTIVSYQVFLLHVVLYAFDRFFLVDAALLALFAGYALQSISKQYVVLTRVLVVVLISFQFGRGTELNLLMLYDTRYRAEKWLASNVPTDTILGLYGNERYLPRFSQYPLRRRVTPWPNRYKKLDPQPEYLVKVHIPRKYLRKTGLALERDFLRRLKKGGLGLEKVYVAKERKLGTLFFDPRHFLGKGQYGYSNLAKVSPDIWVYKKAK